MKRSLTTTVLGASLVVCSLLVSCSSAGDQEASKQANPSGASVSGIDRSAYSNIHAVLDEETQTVETPLSKYINTAEERTQIATANFFDFKECVQSKGYQIVHHYYQVESRPEAPFGVWSQTYAEKYGYSIDKILGRVYVDEGVETEDPATLQAHSDCEAELMSSEIPVLLKGLNASLQGTGTDILGESYNKAQSLLFQDSDVQAAIDEWTQCLADQGIAMDDEYELPIPVIPEDTEAQFKQALLDVECKEKVRLTQRFYDAQAQYEQALIEKNQSAFNSLAEVKAKNLELAHQKLQENGITP